MSGVAAPVYPITEPFGTTAVVPTDITLPIPVPSQIGTLNGAASFEDGFPPATRTDPETGGIPPFGQDMNGILYMMSVYCALIQAGQLVPYDAAAAAEFGGYVVGARLASITTLGLVWENITDGNTNDPDTDPTGWAASIPQYDAQAPAAGTYDDYVLPGASDYFFDVDTTAGAVDFSGFVAQRDGQKIFISNTGANLLQVLALNGGSGATAQIRSATDLGIVQNQTLTIQYCNAIGKWLLV